jgi:hypothetical protein
MPDGMNLKTLKKMGAVKEFYHDLIEKRQSNHDFYSQMTEEQLRKEEEEYYYKHFKPITKWQNLLIQLRAWRSQSISTITNFWKTKNLF